jgi:hypothetical protein
MSNTKKVSERSPLTASCQTHTLED